MTLRHLRRFIRDLEDLLEKKILKETERSYRNKKIAETTTILGQEEELRKLNIEEKNKDKLKLKE